MRHFLILAFLVTFCWVSQGAAEGKRVALVIGNSSYETVPQLPNPRNDARDLSVALERLGFDVITGIDLAYRDMRLALRDFAALTAEADIALIYYAGHGIEVDKRNYMIPVDAALKTDTDVAFETITLQAMLSAVAPSKGVKIVLLDACRNNPFRGPMSRTVATRSLGRGLAKIDPGGVLVGYAAREGTEALDGTGRNSPYAQALLKHIEEPGLEIGRLFRKVRDTVFAATEGRQEPYTYGSLPGRDIFLAGLAPQPEAPEVAASDVAEPDESIVSDFALAQGLDNRTAWRAFLDAYGEQSTHPLVEIAQRQLNARESEVQALRSARNRKPFFEPEAGMPSYGALTLNRAERQLVQEALNFAGFDTGGIDGAFGPKTLSALTAVRYKAGLPAGSIVDVALLRALPDAQGIKALLGEKARRYKSEDVARLWEPRLTKAVETLKYRELVFDYFEGSLYVAVLGISHNDWIGADLQARNAGGHLAAIVSAAENAFLYRLFTRDPRFVKTNHEGDHGPSFGLFQRPDAREPGGGWAWANGEPMTYRNWSPGKPDDVQGLQKYGSFFVSRNDRQRGRKPSRWNDTSGLTTGYIIEIK